MTIQELIYRYKYIYAPQLRLTKPVDVSLELMSACDLACRMCYHSDKANLPFKIGKMNIDLAFMIIDQCADLGVNSIKTNYRGESTLHPDFEAITRYAKSYAKGSTFIDRLTNSNFNFNSGNDSIFRGLANQTKVKISIDSFRKDILEDQRRNAKYDRVMNNIDIFYNHSERIKSETKIVIQAVRSLLNKDEDIYGEAKRRWPDVDVSIRDLVGGRVDKDISDLEAKKRDPNNRQECIQASARLIIHHDGKISPCCPSFKGDLIIGDANKDMLYDVFNSDKVKELRKDLKTKKAFEKDPCKSCSSHESYKGYKPNFNS